MRIRELIKERAEKRAQTKKYKERAQINDELFIQNENAKLKQELEKQNKALQQQVSIQETRAKNKALKKQLYQNTPFGKATARTKKIAIGAFKKGAQMQKNASDKMRSQLSTNAKTTSNNSPLTGTNNDYLKRFTNEPKTPKKADTKTITIKIQ